MNRQQRVLEWTRPAVRGLKPYYKAPVEGDPLRMDQNTNLYGPNPALARVDPARIDFTLYPSRDADDLLAALAHHHGVSPDHFTIGNGSDEILDIITKAFTRPGQTLATPWPGYSLYPFYATLQDLGFAKVPLRGGFRLDVDALLETDAAVTVVASPNNPTGNRHPAGELERLIEGASGIVVVDEAYIEYAPDHGSLASRVEDHDNLIVMRTFSKSHGLAALRIGYAVANQHLTERLRLVKPPFNLNAYAEAVACEALADTTWMEGVITQTAEERDRLMHGLKRVGLRPHPSDANFILCDAPDPAGLSAALRNAGILARTFPGADGLDTAIRFTVGRPEHNDRLLQALAEVA